MTTTPTTDGPEATARRTRRNLGHVKAPEHPPVVLHGTVDGDPVVWVELSGRHGRGKMMTLDAADWPPVERVSPWWTVGVNGTAQYPFVTSGKHRMALYAGQAADSSPNLPLARFLTGTSDPRMVVWYRDRNPFNLRRSNLEVITKAEFYARVRDIVWMMHGVDLDPAAWGLGSDAE
jgi:hypothetical protein